MNATYTWLFPGKCEKHLAAQRLKAKFKKIKINNDQLLPPESAICHEPTFAVIKINAICSFKNRFRLDKSRNWALRGLSWQNPVKTRQGKASEHAIRPILKTCGSPE